MNITKKRILWVLIGIFTTGSLLGQTTATEGKLRVLVEKAVQDEKVIGLSAGVLHNDSIVMTASSGYSNAAKAVPFTENTITRTASITKPMTAIAIFQLVEAGKLRLQDRASAYVDGFGEAPLATVTIQQLLQHSSGISQYKGKKEVRNQIEYPTLEDALAIFVERELLFEPGSGFFYTSYGYVVLGIIIEKVSGLSYADYLRKHIFEPSGMTHTSIEHQGQNPAEKALIYHQSKPGKIKEITDHNISDRIPAGGVQSTVRDLLNFAKAVIDHTLVSKGSFELMVTNSGLKKEGNAYGMGWFLYGDNPNYGPIIGHSGGQLGCSSFLFIAPEHKAASVALSNTSGFGEIGNVSISFLRMTD
ncbi:MAG: beta-lactamase family protein [Flavobacteriaceae bacterium]|nr:beta-lactamase family protein [Flavobacteriaceae bacterium]